MIYFDNGATSYPKPKSVLNAYAAAMRLYSFNSGRGGYRQSVTAAEKIYETREKIAAMIGAQPQNVAFTKNCTEALNIAICGSITPGCHVIISSLEHNSVWRVVSNLQKEGKITFDIADFDFDFDKCAGNFERLIKPETRLIVCMSASNVFGVVFPIEKIGNIAKKHGVRFAVDAAQSAGVMPINMKKDNVDIICAPGHKCLCGPMGTGFIALGDNVELKPLLAGGTGSDSLNSAQPDFMPDRLEAGTLNNPGIIALGSGIDYINKRKMSNVYSYELFLAQSLYDGLSSIPSAVLYCPRPSENHNVPLISFNIKNIKSEKTAAFLAENDIAVRAGYHCSPLAHGFFGTLGSGTVRLCPSAFNTLNECEIFLNTVKKL